MMKTAAKFLVLSVLGFLIVLTGCSPIENERLLSDQALLDKFAKNRTLFETLVAMANEDDGYSRISRSRINPSAPELNEDRKREYYTLFDELGVDGFVKWVGQGATLHMKMSNVGISIGGAHKGIAYAPGAELEVVESLDNDPKTYEGKSFFYRRISGGWYLYMMRF